MIGLTGHDRSLCRAGTPPRPSSGSTILDLDRFGKGQRRRAHLGVCVRDGSGIVPRVRMVEARHSGVERLPQIARPSAASSRPQLVGRLGVLGSGNRAPGQAQLCCIATDPCLGSGGLSERSQTACEAKVWRRNPMGSHRRSPLILCLIEPVEQLPLACGARRRVQLFTAGRRHPLLPSRRFFGIDEASAWRPLFPPARRRGRAGLERGQQLLEILARHAPHLADPDAAEHPLLYPRPHGLGRHLQPLCDLANRQEFRLLRCTVRCRQLRCQV